MSVEQRVNIFGEALPEPGWSDVIKAQVVKVTDHWVVGLMHTIYNDRIFLSSHDEWRNSITAAWCYDRVEAPDPLLATVETLIVATNWDPEVDREPPGYKKCAFDARKGSLL